MCKHSDSLEVGKEAQLSITSKFSCEGCGSEEGFDGKSYRTVYLGHLSVEGAKFDNFRLLEDVRCPACNKLVHSFYCFCSDAPGGYAVQLELLSSSGLGRLPFKEETAGSNPASSTLELASNGNIERGH